MSFLSCIKSFFSVVPLPKRYKLLPTSNHAVVAALDAGMALVARDQQESVLDSFLTCRNIGRNSRFCNLSMIVNADGIGNRNFLHVLKSHSQGPAPFTYRTVNRHTF
jgi:hypothetical protein